VLSLRSFFPIRSRVRGLFPHEVRTMRRRKTLDHKTAIFRQVNKNVPGIHHDALEFPDGKIVRLTYLCEGQEATRLATSRSTHDAGRSRRTEARGVRRLTSSTGSAGPLVEKRPFFRLGPCSRAESGLTRQGRSIGGPRFVFGFGALAAVGEPVDESPQRRDIALFFQSMGPLPALRWRL